MKVHVDPEFCGGTGLCVETCSEVFELTDEQVAKVKVDEVPTDFQQACKKAAQNCPTMKVCLSLDHIHEKLRAFERCNLHGTWENQAEIKLMG